MPEKNTYCKNCGGLINNKTKKCSGCGKQYFRFSKRVAIVGVASIFAIGLIGANVCQYMENKQTVQRLNDKVSASIEIRSDLINQRDELSMELGNKNIELMFWDKYAVICTTEGYKYHRYGCGHLEGRTFYIYNIDKAIALGYTPCLDCYKSSGLLSDYIEQNK